MNKRLKLHHSENTNCKREKMQFYVGKYGIGYTKTENGVIFYYLLSERNKNVFLHIDNGLFAIRKVSYGYLVSFCKNDNILFFERYNENFLKNGKQEYYDVKKETWHYKEFINGKQIKK